MHTQEILNQMDERSSIINQGDIFVKKRNEREAYYLANYDNLKMIPP